jgi:salicylate hydroxylase
MSILFDLAAEQRGKVVHRAALLAELLKPIPEGNKHTNKKVTNLFETDDTHKLNLQFSDGTAFQADAVIGADGVRGHIRGYVLGKENPAMLAKSAGFWDARSLVPMQKARELLGEEYFEVTRQYGWIGDGGFFMHDVLDDGETVQFVLSGVLDEFEEKDGDGEENKWTKSLDRVKLEKMLGRWKKTPTPLKKAIVEVMLQNPNLKGFAQEHHEIDATTYVKGCVAIMGDAAHCMTPWQGSGAGQAIEDAMILETLIEHSRASNQLNATFEIYDQLRRPRTQRIVHSSAETGLILCGRGPDTGLDIDKIRDLLPGRWAFIYDQNQTEHKKEALAALKAS